MGNWSLLVLWVFSQLFGHLLCRQTIWVMISPTYPRRDKWTGRRWELSLANLLQALHYFSHLVTSMPFCPEHLHEVDGKSKIGLIQVEHDHAFQLLQAMLCAVQSQLRNSSCVFFFLLFSKRPDSGSAAGIQQGKRRKHLSLGLWLRLLILHLNTRPAEMDARHSLGSGSQHCWGGSALKSHTANTWYY